MKLLLCSSLSARRLARATGHWPALFSLLLLTASLAAQERQPADAGPGRERKPADGVPRGERVTTPGAPRGERQPGADRVPGAGGARAEFPADIKLTDEQQAKLKEINATFSTRQADLAKQRDSILTGEQRAAQAEAMKQLREGNFNRQEAADLLAAAVKLTPEQKSRIEALDLEARQLHQESTAQKMALLTEEQRSILRKVTIAGSVARSFTIPGGIAVTEDQKTSLMALNGELGTKLADLTEKQAILLTDERRAAREAAYKEARESGKDRQETAEAVDAALKMTAAEKAELAEVEQSLRELNQQIRERITALLTEEQRAELEKRFGRGRD